MSIGRIQEILCEGDCTKINAIYQDAHQRLDHSPRFKFYTLHGKKHLDSLFRILFLFVDAGLKLNQREAFLLCAAICTHDLGMVVPLRDKTFKEISQGLL